MHQQVTTQRKGLVADELGICRTKERRLSLALDSAWPPPYTCALLSLRQGWAEYSPGGLAHTTHWTGRAPSEKAFLLCIWNQGVHLEECQRALLWAVKCHNFYCQKVLDSCLCSESEPASAFPLGFYQHWASWFSHISAIKDVLWGRS